MDQPGRGHLVIGTVGLFGPEKDPLSAVILLPLGPPWNLLAGNAPDAVRPWLAALAAAVTVAVLAALCRAVSVRS